MNPPSSMASNSQFARRVAEFKAPRFHRDSQEKRRQDALAEQKRKRAERIQSSRNIDLFAGLSLGSPKADGAALPNDEDDEDDVVIPHQGLAQFVKMLPSASGSSLPTPSEPEIPPEHQLPTAFGSTSFTHARRKHKPKHNKAKKSKKPTAKDDEMAVETAGDGGELDGNPLLSNAIMYAELLEMNADLVEWNRAKLQQDDLSIPDGIPSDLETGWVALAPIPRGKRCMAISYQAVYDNRSEEPATRTLLHSRVKGKAFLTFPSPLPPNSILDCILDDNWHQNGVLHIVDILRWRGSDFVDCEAEFRFWWRDSKLSELPKFPLPNAPRSSSQSPSSSSTPPALFPYPVYFLGVPYYSPPLTLPSFLQTLIPAARTNRQLSIQVPIPKPPPPPKRPRAKGKGKAKDANASMEVEAQDGDPGEETMETEATAAEGGELQDEFGRDSPAAMSRYLQNKRVPTPPVPKTRMESTSFVSDGILLYVSQASYQPGETPLACWIPAEPLPVQDQVVEAVPAGPVPSPLDIFQSLIYRRCVKAKDALEGNGASNAGVIPQR